jgi:hypothetical protein
MVFLWLCLRQRLPTNDRRFRKGFSSSDRCPFCPRSETSSHLLIGCQSIQLMWAAIPALHIDLEHWHYSRYVDQQRLGQRNTVFLAILWGVWKRRNAMIFRNRVEPLHVLLQKVSSDLMLWSIAVRNVQDKGVLTDRGVTLSHLV